MRLAENKVTSKFDYNRAFSRILGWFNEIEQEKIRTAVIAIPGMGGVGGHAGLFSNAHDLGIFMQMLLNGGNYGGYTYIKTKTVSEFTRCHYCEKNRRAVGFDKPEMDYSKDGPTCQCISEDSFGHTGFTGTIAWADPDKKLVYIFLSNRINPDALNKKLIKMNIITAIMEAIYSAIDKGKR